MVALSGVVVIPEASMQSGAMRVVLAAQNLGRGVGAVPGPVTSVASSGPNELIKQSLAVLVTQPRDVIALLDADRSPTRAAGRPEVGHHLDTKRVNLDGPGHSL